MITIVVMIMYQSNGLIFFFFFSWMIPYVHAKDWCQNYKSMKDVCKRLIFNKWRYRSEDTVNDMRLETDNIFYGIRGYQLLGEPPESERCGTMFPVWVKDLPKEGVVGRSYNLTACVVVPSNACTMKLAVVVHYCKDLMIYKLSKTPGEAAYCLDYTLGYKNLSCLASSSCSPGSGMFGCHCKNGQEGTRCQSLVDYCVSNPCRNGARCSYGFDTYHCKCPPGFTGKNCEYEEPCQRYTNFPHVCERLLENHLKDAKSSISDTSLSTDHFFGNPGFRLATKPPQSSHKCGAVFPVWIKNMPKKETVGEAATITGCLMDPLGKCQMKVNLSVHFCKDLPVYRLANLPPKAGYCVEIPKKINRMSKTIHRCRCLKENDVYHCKSENNCCNATRCMHGGTCINALDTFVCQCAPGFYGRTCEIKATDKSALVAVLVVSLVLLAIGAYAIIRMTQMLEDDMNTWFIPSSDNVSVIPKSYTQKLLSSTTPTKSEEPSRYDYIDTTLESDEEKSSALLDFDRMMDVPLRGRRVYSDICSQKVSLDNAI